MNKTILQTAAALGSANRGPIPSERGREIGLAHAARRRANRRRVWIAGFLASVVGACSTIAAVMAFVRVGSLWREWVERDLAGVQMPSGIIVRGSPLWAEVLEIGAPAVAFVIIGVAISSQLYRLLRGKPLPKDTENTRCGWCQHELRGISTPACGECGHRIGDQGPDEQGQFPASRCWPRRFAARIVLPVVFL